VRNNIKIDNFILMGNCNQNFEDVGDYQYIDNFEVSRRPPPSHEPREYSQDLSPLPHSIDQEAIHHTKLRPQEPIVEVVPEEGPQGTFPEESEVVEAAEQPRRGRPTLEELDLSFYHSLGLPDYEYQEIPEEERELFEGVETYELKDNYGVKYVGEWLDKHIHGNGVLLSNTSKYIGQFKMGLKHYHGREILKNEVYEGQFEGGRRKGLGIRYTPTLTQRGRFDDDFIEGDIFHLDGRTERKDAKTSNRANESFQQ
jgi:hypothetical protein